MPESEEDVLKEIRKSLVDLPENLARAMGVGREMRYAQLPQRDPRTGRFLSAGQQPEEETGPFDERYRATQGLLGAGSAFVPQLGQLAGLMRDVSVLVNAFERFQEAFKPPEPFVGPLQSQAKGLEFVHYGMKPEGWMPPEPKLAENEFAVSPEDMADFRAKLTGTYPIKPESWVPPEREQGEAPPSVETFPLKPESWLPPEREKQEAPQVETFPIKPEVWQPGHPEDEDFALPPLPPLPRKGTPPGWENFQPLMSPSMRSEMMPKEPERPTAPDLFEGLDEPKGEGSQKVVETLEEVRDAIYELRDEGRQRDTGQLPPAEGGEQASSGQQTLTHTARHAEGVGNASKKTGPTGENVDKAIDYARLLGGVLRTAAEAAV